MFRQINKATHPLFKVGLIVVLAVMGVNVQAQSKGSSAARADAHAAVQDAPLFREYKGVSIGVAATVVHQKLGEPKEPSDTQDFYTFSEHEMVQVFYDDAHKVKAFSVTFVGDQGDTPNCVSVLGVQGVPNTDGTIYKMVRYAQAGYWVSFNRIPGDSPITTITVQKLR